MIVIGIIICILLIVCIWLLVTFAKNQIEQTKLLVETIKNSAKYLK